MKLKGSLAAGIRRLRKLRENHRLYLEKGWNAVARHTYMEYLGLLDFFADYYGIHRWNYLERLVLDPDYSRVGSSQTI